MMNLPLFPLRTVLFPRAPVRLRVFEDRYKAMMERCIVEEVPFGVVRVEGERIQSIEEKPVDTIYINAGIYALDPAVCERVPCNQQYDMTHLFRDLLEEGASTYSFPVVEYWIDIGHLSDLERANADYLDQAGLNRW